jgi:hypothetical protein
MPKSEWAFPVVWRRWLTSKLNLLPLSQQPPSARPNQDPSLPPAATDGCLTFRGVSVRGLTMQAWTGIPARRHQQMARLTHKHDATAPGVLPARCRSVQSVMSALCSVEDKRRRAQAQTNAYGGECKRDEIAVAESVTAEEVTVKDRGPSHGPGRPSRLAAHSAAKRRPMQLLISAAWTRWQSS